MARKGILVAAAVVLIAIILTACGNRRGNVTQLPLTQPETGQPAENQQSTDCGVLPEVLELDTLASGTCKSVRSGMQVISFGADYSPELSDTTSDREYSIEPSGTSLNLRGYEPGDYAYALYRQATGGVTKPLQTLIDSEVCAFGGGQDDDIPLVYYLGLADYTLGTWRWYGPFIDNEPPYEDIDALITVNSETLKSRFTSPSDNFYLCVLTTNPGRATSSLSDEGLAAELPFEPRARTVSADELDPGGVRIEVVTTDTEEGLDTEPVVVTGLVADADEAGVALTWDANLDPDVFMYQVVRVDPDNEDDPILLEGVLSPTVIYTDTTGIPGKEYRYLVRARNDAGFGGWAFVLAMRLSGPPVPPEITSVSPISGEQGTDIEFTATVTGSWPFTYAWDFGGGATPDASSDESPTVTLGDEGDYEASLTVTNAYGEDTYPFILSVWGEPPIELVVTDMLIQVVGTTNTEAGSDYESTEFYVAPSAGGDTFSEAPANQPIVMVLFDIAFLYEAVPYDFGTYPDNLPDGLTVEEFDTVMADLQDYMQYAVSSTEFPPDWETWEEDPTQPEYGYSGTLGPNDPGSPLLTATMADNDYTQGSASFVVTIDLDLVEDVNAPEIDSFEPDTIAQNKSEVITVHVDWGEDESGTEVPLTLALYDTADWSVAYTFLPGRVV